MRCPLLGWLAVVLCFQPSSSSGQDRPAPARQLLTERLQELEKRVQELEAAQAKSQAEASLKDQIAEHYSKGVITLGGFQFRLGGNVRIDFVDTQNETDPVFGSSTDNPDPHLEVDKFRLIPRIDFPKSDTLGEFSLRGQIDFLPMQGDTVLKETTLNHQVTPVWWIDSRVKVGLDDRFIRPQRLTQNYPLVGTAFWRDETVALFWRGTIGDKRGRPEETTTTQADRKKSSQPAEKKSKKSDKKSKSEKKKSKKSEAQAAVDPDVEPADVEAPFEGEPTPARDTRAPSTVHAPFDFANNPGAMVFHFSIGDGFGANGKEIGKDNARLHEVLQDSRDLDPPLSLREVGVGVGYERDFRELGELEILGFYYEDELTDDAVSVLQTELTERDVLGTAIRGYGDSDSRNKTRMGFNANYHFAAYHLYQALGVVDAMNPRRGDGLYVSGQWITARDGELDRDGWYAQASWRFSNPARPRWRFFRTIEPVVRYGELTVDQAHIPSLPFTWSRRQWLLGTIFGLADGVFVRAEYAFNTESTGAGKANNNELLIQLLAEF